MTLPASGPISLSQVQTEFGGENPISMSEYYRNGSYVTDNNTGIPIGNQIGMLDLLGAERIVGKDVVTHIAAAAGSYASRTPSDYTGGMYYWSETETFTNTPINAAGGSVFRSGNTNDSTFTAQSSASSLGFTWTTALAWQNSRTVTVPQDPKINGSAATVVDSAHYATTATSNNSKVYAHSYNLFKANEVLQSGSSASVDFQAGGSVTYSNEKGGIVLLHGEWQHHSNGSALSGSGTFDIPANMICLLICTGNTDGVVNLMGLGTNSNVGYLLNLMTGWYDNCQVAVIGNKTETAQTVSYSLNGDAIVNPVPVFFEMA